MSQRQTWLIRRDIVVGQPWGSRLAPVSGRHVVSRDCSRCGVYAAPAACIVAARAACYSAFQFAAVLPLGAPGTRSNIVGSRCGGDAWGWSARYDSLAYNHENPFCKPKKLRAGRFSPIRASSARKSRTATWEASFIKTTTCAAALKPRAAVAQALNTASTRAAQHKHSSRRAHQSMPLLRSWSLWRSILPILAGPAFCLLTVEAFRGDGRRPEGKNRGEQGGSFGEARREEET